MNETRCLQLTEHQYRERDHSERRILKQSKQHQHRTLTTVPPTTITNETANKQKIQQRDNATRICVCDLLSMMHENGLL